MIYEWIERNRNHAKRDGNTEVMVIGDMND